jgi:hypothetical protein
VGFATGIQLTWLVRGLGIDDHFGSSAMFLTLGAAALVALLVFVLEMPEAERETPKVAAAAPPYVDRVRSFLDHCRANARWRCRPQKLATISAIGPSLTWRQLAALVRCRVKSGRGLSL